MHLLSGRSVVQSLLTKKPTFTEKELDWISLQREGLLGLVVDEMLQRKLQPPDSPYQIFLSSIAFQMAATAELQAIGKAALEASVKVLVFKGASLVHSLYPRPGMRPFGDMDLAVSKKDWNKTRKLLATLGFEESLTGQFAKGPIHLDLHQHPLHQLSELVGMGSDIWWSRTEPLFEGVSRLSLEDEFVLSLFHGAKHSFSRAGWVVDAALLAQKGVPERLAQAVKSCRARRQLAYANECLSAWFEVGLPGVLGNPGVRLNWLEHKFLRLVISRRAPDFLGVFTPVSSASSPVAAVRYLRRALYPDATPFLHRTRQLVRLIGRARQA